jgi:hypothetical protein
LKDAGVTNQESQLGQIWSRLDDHLQEVIDEPDPESMIEGFIRKLEEKQYTWKRKFERASRFNYQSLQTAHPQTLPTRAVTSSTWNSNAQSSNPGWANGQNQLP